MVPVPEPVKTSWTILPLLGFIAGCVVLPIPTPHGRTLEGTEVKPADLAFLQPAVTPKEEVTRRLGPPTLLWRDENVFVYRWVQRKGVVIWAAGGGYSAGVGYFNLTAEFAYLVRFDRADRFEAAETVPIRRGKPFGDYLLEWRDTQRARRVREEGSEP